MLELINTSDGSHTVRHTELNETYHSRHGAILESKYVYIQQGLHYFIDRFQTKTLRILEIGFGTGLNALLTMMEEKALGIKKIYHTVEAFPLSGNLLDQLNYPHHLGEKAISMFSALHQVEWGKEVQVADNFVIQKIQSDIRSHIFKEGNYDLVYYDAFAPKVQPELWTKEVLANVIRVMSTDGVLVTYCASGQFKRNLKDLNMVIEEVPGPPGKRVMVRTYRLRK